MGVVRSLQAVCKSYGPLRAVDTLDLEIPAGSTVALLGPNGAGKTSTIAILLGQLEADAGTVRLLGGTPTVAVAQGHVGAMLQDGHLMDGVRVGTLVSVVRRAYPQPAGLDSLVEAAGIARLLDRRTDRLSGGESQRVRFALAAAGNPALMVLDEPTVAMDVEARAAFWAALEAQAAHGRTVLFSTHYLEEAQEHAGRIVLLRAGSVVADGAPEEIVAAAGVGRALRFRTAGIDPDRFRSLPGVTGVDVDGDRVTLHTRDSDATIWGLHDFRTHVRDLEIVSGGLQEAFLALTAP
jgi:ABC-2 type transport system ATP-binding protein